jgi:DNA-binding transcriptional LysR family regulator
MESPLDRFEQMRVLAAVIERGSFTGAAEQLGNSRANVSKYVAGLERRLGVRLLNRTSRRVSVTEAGRAYYERCRSILSEIEEAERSANKADRDISGELRVVAPVNFGRAAIGAAMVSFLRKFPNIKLDLRLNDRRVDPIDAGYDIAIRIGNSVFHASPNLGVCRISTTNRILCASPDYLVKRGVPQVPQDLATHDCLSYSYADEPQSWHLKKGKKQYEVAVSGRIITSSGIVLNAAASAGFGIAYGPENFFKSALSVGRLKKVLPAYELPQFAVWSTFPMGKNPSAKVSAFNTFMTKFMKRPEIELAVKTGK